MVRNVIVTCGLSLGVLALNTGPLLDAPLQVTRAKVREMIALVENIAAAAVILSIVGMFLHRNFG